MGKGLNPADAYRKAQRQKELKKAKEKRQLQQEVSSLLNDPHKIDEEIQKVQKQSDENRMDNGLKNRLKELQQMKAIALRKQQQAKLLNKSVGEISTITPNSPGPIQSHSTGLHQNVRNVPIMQVHYGHGMAIGGMNGIPLPPPRPLGMGGMNGIPLPPPRPLGMGGMNGIPLPPPRPISNETPFNTSQQQIQNRNNNIDRSISEPLDPLDPSNKRYTERTVQQDQSNNEIEGNKWDMWDTSGYDDNQLNETMNHTVENEEEDLDNSEEELDSYDEEDNIEEGEENIKVVEKVEISDHQQTHSQPFFCIQNMPKPLSAEELLKRRNATVNNSCIGPSMDTTPAQKIVEEDSSNVLTSLFGSYGDEEDDNNNLIIPQNESFLQPQDDIGQQVKDAPNKLKVIKAEAGIKALVPNVLRFKRGLSNPLPVNKKLKSAVPNDEIVSKASTTNSVDDAYLSFMNEIKDVL